MCWPLSSSTAAVGRPGFDDRLGQLAQGGGGQGDVEETGAGDVDAGDAVLGGEPVGDGLGDLPRRAAGRLGQPEGDVGRVVPVIAALGTLDQNLVGGGAVEIARGDRGIDGGPDRGGEVGWCHLTIVEVGSSAFRGPEARSHGVGPVWSGRPRGVGCSRAGMERSAPLVGCPAFAAPVAQGIEHRPPEAVAQVRILPGAPRHRPGFFEPVTVSEPAPRSRSSPRVHIRTKLACLFRRHAPYSVRIHSGTGRMMLRATDASDCGDCARSPQKPLAIAEYAARERPPGGTAAAYPDARYRRIGQVWSSTTSRCRCRARLRRCSAIRPAPRRRHGSRQSRSRVRRRA